MKSIQPRRPRILVYFSLTLAITVFVIPERGLGRPRQVDVSEAKAELAKARAAADQSSAPAKPSGAAEVGNSASSSGSTSAKPDVQPLPKRKGWFSKRDPKSAEPAASETNAIPEPTAAPPKRPKLFARWGKGSKTTTAKESAETETEVSSPEKTSAQRFTLFGTSGKDRSNDESESQDDERGQIAELHPSPSEPAASEATVASQSAPEESSRKRLLPGLFAKRAPATEESGVVVAELEPINEEKDIGSGLAAEEEPLPAIAEIDQAPARPAPFFGLFRKGDPVADSGEAKKTKLGFSFDSNRSKEDQASGEKDGWHVITDEETAFYAIGPSQPLPPEKMLDRGSMLTVTKSGWGWCNVELSSGEHGVVATDSMRPATLAEVARHHHPVATASETRGSGRLFGILSRGPAPEPALPSNADDTPIRNHGLLPSLSPSE